MRRFSTGATRDDETEKPVYNRFNSALVEKRFGSYMHEHRKQSDGGLRAGDNWKRGIPVDAYWDSLHRHFLDLWLILEGYPEVADEPDIEKVLCAMRFNVNGMLQEVLLHRNCPASLMGPSSSPSEPTDQHQIPDQSAPSE